MDVVLVELILWVGLAFFIWALRDNLGNVEAEIEAAQALKSREIAARAVARRFVNPEQVEDPIGAYRGATIHGRMVFQGRSYRFDHICPPEDGVRLQPGECYVAPGLVYVREGD